MSGDPSTVIYILHNIVYENFVAVLTATILLWVIALGHRVIYALYFLFN